MKKSIFSFVVLSMVLFIVGCVDSVNTAENVDKVGKPTFVRNKRVITDTFLANRLVLERVDKKELPTGLLQIQVRLKSMRVGFFDWLFHGDDPYKIEYRFHWFNESGMEVRTATSTWIEKDVIPGDTIWIQAVAPNERCKDFVVKIKESQN